MSNYRWLVYALVGALFAAVVNVLTKKALEKTDPVLAITLQSMVMLATLSVVMTVRGGWGRLGGLSGGTCGLLLGAGVAAAMAWYFGYNALNLADVSKATTIDRLSLLFAVVLAMIFLHERPGALNWAGVVLMLAGAICVAQSNGK